MFEFAGANWTGDSITKPDYYHYYYYHVGQWQNNWKRESLFSQKIMTNRPSTFRTSLDSRPYRRTAVRCRYKLHSRPMQVHSNPMQVHSSSMQVHIPHSRPMQIHCNPMQVHSSPMQVHRCIHRFVTIQPMNSTFQHLPICNNSTLESDI